jgi:cytosine/adenosine deaminase-related metal-dependent hydrolase
MALATELGLAEITLSGCTTVADHHYLWPEGISAQISFDAADKFGVRFHLGRGSLNIGKRDGGYAPDSLIQDLDTVISETADVIRQFHDPGPGSFRQVFVAPNSLRTVTPELMRASAALAAQMGTQLHFHLGETKSEIDFTQKKYSRRPVPLAEDLGCLTPHTWLAHGVHFNCDDMDALSRCQCGICHCPSSNMRLSSGVAPIRDYLDRNIVVGLGVDGSASNDSSNFLSEIRSALLLSRIGAEHDEDLVTARSILELATLNGARLLGRNDVGRLAPGYAADFIAFDSERLEIIGSEDPVAAVAFCAMTRVDHSWVHGRPVVRNGKLARLNLDDLIEKVRSRPKSVALTNSY